jgi:hypothetical protein
MRCHAIGLGILLLAVLLAAPAPTAALETQAYQMKEDFGSEPLYDTWLNYYYYIPCPTYSWFWSYSGWEPGDIVGEWFHIGDMSTGVTGPADPLNCQTLEIIRVLDFAGYGTVRAGFFTVEFDVYCTDEYGCPVGPSLWNSGPYETGFAWNYIYVDPPLELCNCPAVPGDPASGPRILVTATHTGSAGIYPQWGMDNISTAIEQGCPMHDYGCLPALYPRPYSSHYPTMHSGFYGQDFQYCPPQWWKDGRDPTPDGTQYGFIELTWRLYLACDGPSANQPSTWSSIKSMYR